MAERRNVFTRALIVWVPVVVVATVILVLIFAVGQQNLRMGANDPQVQMAEDAAARLNAGATPISIVEPQPVDMARSLAPFLIVFGLNHQPQASSAVLGGQTPLPPGGVFDRLSGAARSEITWAPRPDVREAAVIIPYRNGYVLAGRSLRLIEQREDALGQLTILFFFVMLVASGLAALAVCWAVPKRPASFGA
jgi:hypothetical protein